MTQFLSALAAARYGGWLTGVRTWVGSSQVEPKGGAFGSFRHGYADEISTCVDSALHHEAGFGSPPAQSEHRPGRSGADPSPCAFDWNGDLDRNRPTTMHQRLPKIELMQDLRAPTGTRGPRYALVAVAVALFGLLSMHGWGSHTGAHSVGATSQSAIAMIAASGAISHDHSGPAANEPDTSEPIVAGHQAGMSSEEPVDENGAGLLGLCLAVLTTDVRYGGSAGP